MFKAIASVVEPTQRKNKEDPASLGNAYLVHRHGASYTSKLYLRACATKSFHKLNHRTILGFPDRQMSCGALMQQITQTLVVSRNNDGLG